MDHQKGELTFSASSTLRSPKRLFSSMKNDVSAAWALGWEFFRRDLKSRYRESFLGALWALLPAVVMVVGLTLAQRANLVNIGKTDLPYPLYVVLGTALWQLFVDSLNAPVSAFTSSRSMLTKIRFPREAIYVSKVGEVIFDFMMKAFIIAVLFGVYKVIPGISTLLGIFALIPLILFGLALGFLLVPMSVLFQDIVKGTTIATGYLFFLTPIVYPIPDIGVFRTVVSWNPLTPLIVTCRELLTSSDLTYLHGFWVMTAIASCLLILSWAVVYISMPLIIERTSA